MNKLFKYFIKDRQKRYGSMMGGGGGGGAGAVASPALKIGELLSQF